MQNNPFMPDQTGQNPFTGGGSSPTPMSGNPKAPAPAPQLMAGGNNPFGTSAGFSNPFGPTGSNTENGFNTPGSSLLNLGMVPGATAATATPSSYAISPQVQAMLAGNGGFSPQMLTGMKANATESAANAGQQEMAQVKRQMAQNGVAGSPAAAGYAGAVARQTGQAQQANLRDVETANAQEQINQQNMAAQLEQQAGMGNMNAANQMAMGNMQSVNNMALSNAQMLYNALLANQQARLATQFNIYGAQP